VTRPAFTFVAVFVLAPTLAVVLIGALLLFGAEPRLVFLPGHFVKAGLESFGVHAPNRVGVLSTVVFWWAIVLSVWLGLRRLPRTRAQ